MTQQTHQKTQDIATNQANNITKNTNKQWITHIMHLSNLINWNTQTHNITTTTKLTPAKKHNCIIY